MAAPQDLKVARVIFNTECNVITWVEAGTAQHLAQSIGAFVKFFEGDCLARRCHYDGGSIWCISSDCPWKHI